MPELVKDFQGKLIPKDKARKIKNENGKFEFFLEGESCICMPDGQWYRTTTGKITYDWSRKQWVFLKDFQGSKGLVDDGSFGCYSDKTKEVPIMLKKETSFKKSVYDPFARTLANEEFKDTKWNRSKAISEEVALKHGYEESIFDGVFYRIKDCSDEDIKRMKTPNIPAAERTNTYSLDDDKSYRGILEDLYDNNDARIPATLINFAKRYIPYTFGLEYEVQNGFLPLRVREPLGLRSCRDGSLGEGIEFVSIPMEGGKGLYFVKKACEELSKRCAISNKCSVHVHFGEVRRDKLYVLSLWHLLTLIQEELRMMFPFSRTHSIREDGKIYANLLPNLEIKVKNILNHKDDETFKKAIVKEFNKIYTWLNNGHALGEKYDEEFVKETRTSLINGKNQVKVCYRTRTFKYSTKLPHHAVQGRKWERAQRYLWTNILNMFFSHSRTVEFRIHEATTNFDKVLMFMCLCVSILKYAEDFDKVFSKSQITIKELVEAHFPPRISAHLYEYFLLRKNMFCAQGGFKTNYKQVEAAWMEPDKDFKFRGTEIYKL